MPAMALSRVGARVVESGPDGQELAACTWQRLEELPDPRSPRGRVYPLACLVAVALCAFTAAGNDRLTAVGSGSGGPASRTWPGCAPRGTRWQAGTRVPMRRRSGSCWTGWTRGLWPGHWWAAARGALGRRAAAGKRGGYRARRAARQAQALTRGRLRAVAVDGKTCRGARRADGTRVPRRPAPHPGAARRRQRRRRLGTRPAAPPEQDISKIRQLINRIRAGIEELAPHERARIDEAVAVARKHRAVSSACPASASKPDDTEDTGHDRQPAGGTGKMHAGRQADSARRRQRVFTAINQATSNGTEISVSGIARTAAVDRTFLYRHRDLLEQVHALAAAPPAAGGTPRPAVTRASQADLLAAHERAARLHARVRQLEKRLSEALGEQAWRESGLGAPPDTDALNDTITQLEQQAADLRIQLSERDDELAAARAVNRDLMTRINHEPEDE